MPSERFERHPHPMHCVSPALRRLNSAILWSERRAQSRLVGNAIGRQLGQFLANFLKCQPNSLREYDKRNPAQHRSRVTAMPRKPARCEAMSPRSS